MTDSPNKVVVNLPDLSNIKIARVSTVAFFIDTQLHSQISMTVQSGAEVSVIASEPSLNRPIDGAEYFSIDIPREINPLKDLLALVKLWWLFRKQKFDIVHSTTPKAGLLCALAGKFAGVPIRIHSYTGQPWVTLSGLKRKVAKLGDWVIGCLTTACYADSDSQKAFLVSEKLVSVDKLSVIGKGSLAGVDVKR
ncbi:MAG: glycosyltransferase, partial [Methyloprofundus sp.]|nr:glycosyltransferase [Methyloprofundus sp.]